MFISGHQLSTVWQGLYYSCRTARNPPDMQVYVQSGWVLAVTATSRGEQEAWKCSERKQISVQRSAVLWTAETMNRTLKLDMKWNQFEKCFTFNGLICVFICRRTDLFCKGSLDPKAIYCTCFWFISSFPNQCLNNNYHFDFAYRTKIRTSYHIATMIGAYF